MKKFNYLCAGAVLMLSVACCAGCGQKGNEAAATAAETSATKSLSDQLLDAVLEDDGSIKATEWVTKDHSNDETKAPAATQAPSPSSPAQQETQASSGQNTSSGNAGASQPGNNANAESEAPDPSPASAPAPAPSQAPTEDPEENQPASEEECRQALAKAQECVASYTNQNGELICPGVSKEFVKTRLVKAYKFSKAAAKYAAENCGADWNEQAVGAAKLYKTYGLSRNGMIEQLKRDGFTEDESVYGADNSKLDWYSQARIAAKILYQSEPGLSKNEVVDYLVGEGFTSDQADHGYGNYR